MARLSEANEGTRQMVKELTAAEQKRMVEALLSPSCYPHPVERLELLQTHISWVILTGPFVYKLKKVVDFGFLDYSSRDKRHHNVEEELRLNRRTAPDLYLETLPVGGTVEQPQLGGGPALDFALKMRQFPQASLFSAMAASGSLASNHVASLASELHRFHATLPRSSDDTPYGRPADVFAPMRDNFATIREQGVTPPLLQRLESLEQATDNAYERLSTQLEARRRHGHIRECHGDLHLGNIAWLDGRAVPFDCIEFNPQLRFIDTASELAFVMMDLERVGRPELANRLLNDHLAVSGDFGALPLLHLYLRYRAMVRAKIAILDRARFAPDSDHYQQAQHRFTEQLALAEGFIPQSSPQLLITRGVSGSGKSHLARAIAERLGAIHLRSDVERKRLFGLSPLSESGSAVGSGIYADEAGRRTYQRLLELAETGLDSGFHVIVDATFLERAQRHPFADLARRLGLTYTLLDIEAPETILRERVEQRRHHANDPSEADLEVLSNQLSRYHPLAEDEQREALLIPNGPGDSPVETVLKGLAERGMQ